jgi:hypothetical protein
MPESTGAGQVVGAQYDTPLPSRGYGSVEATDDTRQAQQQVANDSPVDVNPNAIVARLQAAAFAAQQETLTLMGKSFETNSDRRNKIFDDLAHSRVQKQA